MSLTVGGRSSAVWGALSFSHSLPKETERSKACRANDTLAWFGATARIVWIDAHNLTDAFSFGGEVLLENVTLC